MPLSQEKLQAQVQEGKVRAAIQRVNVGPEAAAEADQAGINLSDVYRRLHMGPGDKKGRWQAWVAPPDHLSPAQFHAPGADEKGRVNGKFNHGGPGTIGHA